MKSFIIFVLCLSLTACFLSTKTVNLGEDFTITGDETVQVQGTNLRLKVLFNAFSHYPSNSAGRSPVSCAFTINDNTQMKQLDQGSSMVVEGFNIKLQQVNFKPDSCKFIVTKAE